MATGPGVNQGKTKFVEEYLSGNRDAGEAAVNEAWRAAGHDGTISGSLVGKTRRRLRLTGKKGAAAGASGGQKPGPAAKAKSSSEGTKAKGASKAGPAPAQANGRGGDTGSGKSGFVEDVLGRDPKANVAAINRVWSEAGHEGTISDSVVYKVKRDLGLTGGRSPGGSASVGASEPGASEAGPAVGGSGEAAPRSNGREAEAATAAGAGSSSGGRERLVDEVEAGIDELMFTLKSNGGMPEVEAALRAARRLLTRNGGGG